MNKVFFSPGEDCRQAIIEQLHQSVSSIKICVFTISDDLITDVIIARHQFGIDIRIITDNDKCYDDGSDIDKLHRSGIEIKVDKSPYHMHHKFAIIDNKIALTGSYNWTRSAALYNHENIVFTSDKGIVKDFKGEFDKLWEQMEDY
ncbi:phosphatidylserine/phosphatidylglycerophosphate/cardiolipin synthase-like protein [Sporocytophaga myxococcoides]|uniref:phospholipase D n=1 Tax=Sporocytophaga myxococcoides TaxID=153721 RepID=A0A098LD64_9BACT|nr:phospholipase D-like domain-containing protein [Sporocytophaga myxococcoides]GAL84352.1 phosphatidylserine/phosphatidylglycerophosphate/cardiolipin synthase-like protein [Sporocytophaga myxococcoides]